MQRSSSIVSPLNSLHEVGKYKARALDGRSQPVLVQTYELWILDVNERNFWIFRSVTNRRQKTGTKLSMLGLRQHFLKNANKKSHHLLMANFGASRSWHKCRLSGSFQNRWYSFFSRKKPRKKTDCNKNVVCKTIEWPFYYLAENRPHLTSLLSQYRTKISKKFQLDRKSRYCVLLRRKKRWKTFWSQVKMVSTKMKQTFFIFIAIFDRS